MKLRHKETKKVIEVPEAHAEHVLIPQGRYEYLGDDVDSTSVKAKVQQKEVGANPTISTKRKPGRPRKK